MKSINRGFAFFGFLLVMTWAGSAVAGEKPKIGVRFELKEPYYLKQFSLEQEQTIGNQVAEILATKLAAKSAFLGFYPNMDADWTLQVELDRKDPGARGEFHEVGFRLRLDGPGTDPQKEAYWKFRTIDEFYDVDFRVDVFLRQLDRALEEEADYDFLIQEVLRQVPVAHEAEMSKDIFGIKWKLSNLSHLDLCMSVESELIVESKILTDGSVRKVYTKVIEPGEPNWETLQITCEMLSEKNEERIRRALEQLAKENVRVKAIYVQKYVLLRQCIGRFSPEDAGL